MEKIVDVRELKLGDYYLVPCLIVDMSEFRILIPNMSNLHYIWVMPIHGAVHTDKDIGADFNHYHIDWRFVDPNLYQLFKDKTKFKMPWERIIHERMPISPIHNIALKYERPFTDYPLPGFRKILEPLYKDAVMKDFICPHKGLPCNNTPVQDGVIVCRGHGLAWDAMTGKMVSRENRDAK